MNEDLKNIIVSDLILLDKPSSFLDNKRPWKKDAAGNTRRSKRVCTS